MGAARAASVLIARNFEAIAPAVNAHIMWENNQIERLRSGLPEGLPDEHPEVRRHTRRRQAG